MSSNNRNRNNQGYSSNNRRGGYSKPQQTNYVRKPVSSNATQTLSDTLRQPSSSSGGGGVPEFGGIRGGSFVNYLPEDEAVASGLTVGLDSGESQRVVDLLNRELSRLLRLNPGEFRQEVATDTSLHTFLGSFLKNRSRWYDFPHRGGAGGGIAGESELCRRVFMVLYRISSYGSVDAKVLQEKKLLDLPTLLDICALYGRENEDVTRSLVENAIKAQPWLHKEFTEVSKHFLNTVHPMYQRCTSSMEAKKLQDEAFSQLRSDYLEVMDFINDAVVNLDAFVAAYNPAAVFFCCSNGDEELLATLGKLHDALLPSLQRGLRIALEQLKMSDDFVSDVFTSIKLLSSRIINLGGKLLHFCYLGEEAFQAVYPYPRNMFPASMADPRIRTDTLVQKLRVISQQCGGDTKVSFLQSVEKRHQIISEVEFLQNKGWFSVDDKQKQLLYDILGDREADKQIGEEISQIRDLFPEYGKGFLYACLEVYNHSPEEVIQRILEGTLREDLNRMDTWLEEIPRKNPSANASAKGKGKLSAYLPELPSYLSSSSSSAGTSSHQPAVGWFTRKGALDEETLDVKDAKLASKNAALIKRMGYDDEYDDTFDELGIGAGDSGDSDEASNGEGSSVPAPKKKWPSKKTQFYVKDGKNYSYKVPGAIPVRSCEDAALVIQAEADDIYGLGRDGNAGRRWTEPPRERVAEPEAGGRGGNLRGRGRGRGGRGNAEAEAGGGGSRGGRGQDRHDRKNQAARKHNYGN